MILELEPELILELAEFKAKLFPDDDIEDIIQILLYLGLDSYWHHFADLKESN